MTPLPLTAAQARALRKLHHKKGRYQQQAFLVEGRKSVQALLEANNHVVHNIVATAPLLAQNLRWLAQAPCPIYTVPSAKLTALSTLHQNHEILAVAAMRPVPESVTLEPDERALVLDGIQDPGNLGTLMRIADWYGITKIICAPHTVDPYNSKVIHASMGSFAQVTMHYTALKPWLSAFSGPRIGAVLDSGASLHTTTLPPQGVLVVGSESHGIADSIRPLLTHHITIQRHGHAESLNAAMAAAIVCERWVNGPTVPLGSAG